MADEELMQPEAPESDDGGRAIATETAPAKKPKRPAHKPRHLPPFKVLLHNDDVNTFDHVIASILNITTLTTQEAVLRALEAHEGGLALLVVTHLERAELYREQFASTGLTVTIEAA